MAARQRLRLQIQAESLEHYEKGRPMNNAEFAQLRKQLGYGQTELADLMGRSRATISRWGGITP